MLNQLIMNRIIKYVLIFASLLPVLVSCSDWLEVNPEDELVSDEFWTSREDVNSMIFNTYGKMASEVKTMLLWGELRGGMLSDGQSVPTDASRIMIGDITDQNDMIHWGGFYEVINGANQLLKSAPQVVQRDPSFSSSDLEEVQAEAYFLRAMSYFYLVRAFKEVPLITEPYTTDEQDYYPAKSEEQEVLDQIVRDLTKSLDLAAQSYDTEVANRGRANTYAVSALLADVYLWRSNYDQAIEQCNHVINSGEYGLLGASNWFKNFYPGNSNSSIFEIQFDQNWNARSGLYETFSYNKRREYQVNPRSLELFDAADIRGEGATWNEENFEVWKYVGTNPDEERGDALNDNNFIVYRLADVKLMKAEALAEKKQFDQAQAIINEIRSRRGVSEVSLDPTVTSFEDYILDERARELAFEGKRWFDILRMGKRNDYERKELVINALIMNAPAELIPSLRAKFQDPYSWYFPVHRSELQVNTNLEQNPYYKK